MQTGNQYDTPFPTVPDVASENHGNIALVYGDSSKDTYSALAFQVVRGVRRVERVNGLVTLADGETRDFGWVGDNGFSRDTGTPGDEIWRIDSGRAETMVEYGFAVPQDGVYVGMQSADGDSVTGFREGDDRERGLSANDLPDHASVLSDYTYVKAPSVTQDDAVPTTALSERPEQQGLIRIDSQQDGPNRFYFAFNNVSGGQVDIDITAVGVSYHVRPYTDEQTVKDIVRGEYDRRLLTYGGFGNTNPNLPVDWYDYDINVGPGELMAGQS